MNALVRRFVAFLTLLAPSLSPCSASASDVRLNGATLIVNQVPVFAFKTAKAREAMPSLLKGLTALDGTESVSIGQTSGRLFIRIGGVLIQGLEEEAASRSVPSRTLAHEWASKLTYAIGLPALSPSHSELRLAVGGSRAISFVGSGVGRASVSVDDPSIVFAVLKQGVLAVQAKHAGSAIVTISSGIAHATIGIQVKPSAAVFPQTLQVDVSGTPALASTVQGAVFGALKTRFVTAQGGDSQFVMPPISDMRPGDSKTITVNAHVKAPDTMPANGDVKVVIHNLGLPHIPDGALWYSNDPESVTRPGPLFSAVLPKGQSVRLLYHHLNASEVTMFFRVQAINDTDSTASLQVIPGDSQPDKNPVLAGLKAADAYLRAWRFDSGEVVSIPPHSTIPVSLRQVFVGNTMSGLCGLRLVSGPKEMQIRTDAWPQFPVDAHWTAALFSPTPWREVGANPVNDYDTAPYEPSENVYPDPYRDASMDYEVGGRFGEFRLGQKPLASQDAQGRLDGNFGVLYRINATVSNPTKDPADVELMFEASAGYAAGLFLVNGDLKTTSLLQPKAQACLTRIHLSPGAKQTFAIITLPLSGGSYPATLTLRPVPQETNARHAP